MKIAILFDNLGPYHHARLNAAGQVAQVLAIESRQRSRDYFWNADTAPSNFQRITLDAPVDHDPSWRSPRLCTLTHTLARWAPDCVCIPGWSCLLALAALAWCRRNHVPAVLMSESTEQDVPRFGWKERIKSLLVARFSTGLVGGRPQAAYLASLGMPPDRIFLGYDVVDNEYFVRSSDAVRQRAHALRKQFGLPGSYFLASSRFIAKKNLSFLLRAFARYRALLSSPDEFVNSHIEEPTAYPTSAACRPSPSPLRKGRGLGRGVHSCSLSHSLHNNVDNLPWSLVLVGDGSGRASLEQLIDELGLSSSVFLPGFQQYAQLPIYYASAGAFVHASTSEPWGLVVNEAMASGLPVLVSDRCGCVPDLVHHGENGFTFDPQKIDDLADLMVKMSAPGQHRSIMGRAGRELISHWGPARFSAGLLSAARKALGTCPPSP